MAERYPRWSPDGKTLAYWSDRSGEYELTLRPADGNGTERKVTSLGPGFRYPPQWSPDSKKLAFIDQAMRIRVADLDASKVTEIDQSPEGLSHDELERFVIRWSPDSRWITYARPTGTNNGIFLYDTRAGKRHQVTTGYLNDSQPTFDPEGKYLYYASDRAFDPVYGSFDNTWTYPNPTKLVVVTLRKDLKSPVETRNDSEDAALDSNKKPEDAKKDDKKQEEGNDKADEKPTPPPNVDIDLDGLEIRAVVLPPKAGIYADLTAIKGKLLYRRPPRAGSGEEKSPVVFFDLAEREEKTVVEDANDFEATADGKKLLVVSKDKYAIVEIKPNQKLDKPMSTTDMEAPVDPRAEWRQLFADAFRFERDFFYDPGMHGVDWRACVSGTASCWRMRSPDGTSTSCWVNS